VQELQRDDVFIRATYTHQMSGILANRRVVTGELMDSPDIDPVEHRQALNGLRRINKISGVAGQMVRPILDLVRAANLKRISLLDIACGGGDVPVAIAKQLQRRGIEIDLAFLDRSETALAQAMSAARRADLSCNAVQGDALNALLPGAGTVDVVTNSLFLHHLNEPKDVIALLRRMRSVARRMVVVSDLRRSPIGGVVAWIGCRVLSRSAVVHYDGPASVRAAWTMGELKTFAAQAGMDGAIISRCTPWRMLLIWKRPPGADHDESNG
jgi:2-polyprenyl-3-methyl-5-hydroxy-6-metoxy-1,4-benzoquinol methylase